MKLKDLKKLIAGATDDAEITAKDGAFIVTEPMPALPIAERIVTFEDACRWCRDNGHYLLVQQYEELDFSAPLEQGGLDILAYLKLRIITCALNEGWKPDYQERNKLWGVYFDREEGCYRHVSYAHYPPFPRMLTFKSDALAEYAAEQFAPYYADFLGKKGGEE